MEFYEIEPTRENYWRAIILFGRNVASYKFALAKSLYELSSVSDDLVTLEELAEPFSRHLCEHLKHSPKQVTAKTSQFLSACESFNKDDISKDTLIQITKKLGFTNVINAFHTVSGGEIDTRFFLDERKQNKGIRITDNFFKLAEHEHFQSFENETEARWRLVEKAWEMGVSRNLIHIEYDEKLKYLYTKINSRRTDITSCRDSLNGYQKGRCFYCYKSISVDSGDESLAEVDHFIPWKVKKDVGNINGVWNLVLACQECNRGVGGKFALLPELELLRRLHKRNEYFINSHLPLRETLIQQTGANEQKRIEFLQRAYNTAKSQIIHTWKPPIRGIITF